MILGRKTTFSLAIQFGIILYGFLFENPSVSLMGIGFAFILLIAAFYSIMKKIRVISKQIEIENRMR